ncbi:MAG: nicotinamide-nucleotide adenylyltransferase [Candidatus Jordarchaeum sp.]|uniref:nicotinamide-nucleotide adenylyltransferase n=1 Tax=Candidatus Jordarchaeum sp. TaxID=2823881 RepID=UPI004049094B
MIRGLFVGRFQPFHLGHLYVVKKLLEKVGELIIAIGSAQYSHTFKDPFNAGERIWMIRSALDAELDPRKYYVIPIPDVNDNRIWVAHVESYTPPFQIVFSNNSLVKVLFQEAGYDIEPSPLYKRELYCGTDIRKKIIGNEKWEHLVPENVAKIIKEIGGDKRLRGIIKKDYVYDAAEIDSNNI